MTYQEQLESYEWRSKRKEILERDNFCCRNCKIERTPFIGISQKFGIKNYKELLNDGYSLAINDDTNDLMFLKNGFIHKALFVEKTDKRLIVENLFFALRFKEPKNKFVFGSFELICFYKEIKTNDKFPDLNVHHKYYIENRLAWEYNNDILITLCERCHQEEHENNEIKVFDEKGQFLYIPQICDKCFGTGYLPEFHYYQSGICFKCGGNGVILK